MFFIVKVGYDKQVFLNTNSKTLKYVSLKTYWPSFFSLKVSKSGVKDKDIMKIANREFS
jgi:hypothetical protein